MRKLTFVLIASAAFAATASFGPAAAQSQLGDPNAEPVPFQPHMGALMSMLIQPRHARLGLAGKAENWPLAAYALKELRQGFAVVSKAVPRWQGLAVPQLIEAAVDHPITLIDYAIKLRYPAQFNEAYGRLTEGCNACHAATDHSFVVIKVPDVSPFPDQDFAPRQ
jgi:hypothetical protein